MGAIQDLVSGGEGRYVLGGFSIYLVRVLGLGARWLPGRGLLEVFLRYSRVRFEGSFFVFISKCS